MGNSCDLNASQPSSSALTLDSLFGIKGSVRLVPHGASHKPHIILRREPSTENANGASSCSRAARFSLVANKRFTISKGHTLSLGITDPRDDDLKLLNTDGAFTLEFDLNNEIPYTEELSYLPARMRKSLTGTKTFDTYVEKQQHNSLGFPGYPLSIPETRVFASVSVQTDPVEPIEITTSSSKRTPSPMSLEHRQKSPLRLYPSPISADERLQENPLQLDHSREDETDSDAPTERSFSSMDLSTPSQSFNNSPVIRSPSQLDPMIPASPDHDCFVEVPEASEPGIVALNTCEVKGSEIEQLVVSLHEVPSQRKSKSEREIPQPTSASSAGPPPSPDAHTSTPSMMTPTADSRMNAENIPNMPRAMSQLSGLAKTRTTPTPQSTISNPLGIRPSANLLSKRVPRGPRSLLASTSAPVLTPSSETVMPILAPTPPITLPTKKPVVVGAKWTALRASLQPSATTALASSSSTNKTTVAKSTTPGVSSTSKVNVTEGVKGLSQLLRYSVSPPHNANGPKPLMAPVTKQGNTLPEIVLARGVSSAVVETAPATVAGNSPRLLKRVRSGSEDKGKSKDQRLNKAEEQPKKKVKMELKTGSSESGPFSVIATAFSSETSLSPRPTNDASPNSMPADEVSQMEDDSQEAEAFVHKTKSRKRRQRRKVLQRRETEEQEAQGERWREEQDAKESMGTYIAMQRRKEKEEKEKKEKEEVEKLSNAVEAGAESGKSSAPLVPKQTPAPRMTHPLPPKPQMLMAGSSYRPARKRERSYSRGRTRGRSRTTSRSRSRESVSRSRSRSRGRGRDHTPERSRSRSRRRDRSMDRQREKRSKPSDNTETAPVRLMSGTMKWPTTNSCKEHYLCDDRNLPVGVQQIAFVNDGKRIGIACADSTLRIWDTKPQAAEIAKLSSNSSIVAFCWRECELGVITLCLDGSVNTWTPKGKLWQHNKVFDVHSSSSSADTPNGMAYGKDKIAVSTISCVKVWLLTTKGMWLPQREIKRSGVTALCFQPDGSGLFGGCRDGALWYCEVPNGTLRAYAFLPSNKYITSLDIHPNGTQLLVGQKGGTAYLISHQLNENKGTLEKTYSARAEEAEGTYAATFATRGQAVVYGMKNGCALVWDRKKGSVVYGLKHEPDDTIVGIASFDGRPGVEGMMVSGTKQGGIFWWPIPQAAPSK